MRLARAALMPQQRDSNVMKWFMVRNKLTGEEWMAAAPPGAKAPPGDLSPDDFDIVPLPREPGEDDVFDWATKKLGARPAADRRFRQESRRLARLKPDELKQEIEAPLLERLAALENELNTVKASIIELKSLIAAGK